MLLCSFRGPLQFRHASFDVFEFDGLGRMIEYAVGGACAGRCCRLENVQVLPLVAACILPKAAAVSTACVRASNPVIAA